MKTVTRETSFDHFQGSGRPFKNLRPIVLASSSLRRLEFMRLSGLDFHIAPSLTPEPRPFEAESAQAYALRSARAKGLDVAGRWPENPQAVILSADTVVEAPDGRLLGKPSKRSEALDMIMRLFNVKNMTHHVVTACCLLPPGQSPPAGTDGTRTYETKKSLAKTLPLEFYVRSQVVAAGWDREVLSAYAASDEVLDKAGAYAIQGQGAFLIKEIRGSFSNVIGLPMAELMTALLETGFIRACP